MDEEYAVSIGEQAEAQLTELFRYIKDTLQAPKAAGDMLELLDEEIQSLSYFPNRYSLTEEEPWHSMGIRRITVKNYLVYYLVDDAAHAVDVTAVIYGGRNQVKQLAKMETK